MQVLALLVVAVNCIELSYQEDITLAVDDDHVFAVVDVPFNITVSIHNGVWTGNSVLVFWESNGVYVVPTSEQGNKLVFSRAGPGSQMMQLKANLVGIFSLRFYTLSATGRKAFLAGGPQIELVVRQENIQQKQSSTIVLTIIIALALAVMGLDLDMQGVLATVKKPVGPIIGMFCQFILMPVFSYILGWLFLETNYEKLGLLLLGCSPGGAHSNFWTAMFYGDVNLSCTMTFISTLGSFAFTSLWVFLLGTPLVGKTITVPYGQIAISFAAFTLPLIAGVTFKYKWSKQAERIRHNISRPFFLVCLIALPIIAITNNIHFFYLCTWRHALSGACLGFLGLLFGAALATLVKQKRPQIIAISLETAIQNGGIAYIVLNLTFSSPYSDVGILPILSYFFFSTGPFMFIIFAAYTIYNKKGENSEEKEEAKDIEKEKKGEPENKDDSNKEDKNKDKHEEAFNKLKNEARLKHQTPRQKHGSMSDISQYLSPKPYQSLFGNYMEVCKRGRKDEDESSDTSPQGKPKNKKDKKNGRKGQPSSGIPMSFGGQTGPK